MDPVRVRLPGTGSWTTIGAYLVERLSGAAPGVVQQMLADGRIVGADGTPVAADTPYVPGTHLWFHRDLPPEPPVPFPIRIVYRDPHIVVADKPHFLATTPRGSHVTETLLAHLRRELDLPTLGAAHRLDRLTAGLVLFTIRPEERGAYQTLFRDRLVHKTYMAVAPYAPSITLPRTLTSRMEKPRGSLTAHELPGPANAVTQVELAARKNDLALYKLTPRTGQTHQLRLHMSSLGVPILGDPLYPEIQPPIPPDDFTRPLQLLAKELEFKDPLTGKPHSLRSERELEAWTAYGDWADRRHSSAP